MSTSIQRTAKLQEVNDFLGRNYNEFIRQAKIKLSFRYKMFPDDHVALVSDIVINIIEKARSSDRQLDRYHKMAVNGMLFVYVTKAIDINCKSFSAPFLFNQKKILNRIQLSDMHECTLPIEDEEPEFTKEETSALDIIYAHLDQVPYAKKLFGIDDYRYYVRIFKEYYTNPTATYASLAKKYNIPLNSFTHNILHVKKLLLKEVQRHNITVGNRKPRFKA